MAAFDYNRAFPSNICRITEQEKSPLRGRPWSAPRGILYNDIRNPVNRIVIAEHQRGL